jgi:hypothetical protein
MGATGCNRNCVDDTADLYWLIAEVVSAIAKLAVGIVTPTTCGAIVEHGARMKFASRDRNRSGETADLDRHIALAIFGVTIAKLAEGVPTPAFRHAGTENGAGVEIAGCEGDGIYKPAYWDRYGAVLVTAVAKLADSIRAPASSSAVIKHGAGVGESGRDRKDIAHSRRL